MDTSILIIINSPGPEYPSFITRDNRSRPKSLSHNYAAYCVITFMSLLTPPQVKGVTSRAKLTQRLLCE